MSSRGEHEESGRAGPDGGPARELRIGVVLEAFLDWPLDRVLAWLPEAAPEITDIEVGAGGYAPHPHCDVAGLLASAPARAAWLDQIARHGLRLDCLNAWGNPLHPDPDLARSHDEDLRNAIRLAALLGADRVVAMAGCPGATPRAPGGGEGRAASAAAVRGEAVRGEGEAGGGVPHFAAGGWLPYLEGVYERQWEQSIEPYWSGLAEFAAAEAPGLRVCLELHPGTCAFNVETFRRVAALGPSIGANLDPSHFFWMGMDGHRVTEALGDLVGHAHGKDTVFHADNLALNGLLDRRWPEPADEMPWTFAIPGRGHDLDWWAGLMRRLAASQAHVVSIEHEDPFTPAETGLPEAARLLRAAIDAAATVPE
jgi:sugar phosphate isomerase/epimerase